MALSTSFAGEQRLRVGDTLTATVGTLKGQRLIVGSIYRDSQAIGTQVLIPRTLYAKAIPAVYQKSYAASSSSRRAPTPTGCAPS